MYMSRVEINTSDRTVLQNLNHIGTYHGWVEQSFPDEIEKGIRTRKLWRIDQIGGKEYLLVISEAKPNRNLMEKYAVKGSFGCKDYEPFLNSIKQGDKFYFRVVLNPVRSITTKGSKRGKATPLYSKEDQYKFLLEKAKAHGFDVDEDQFFIKEKEEETLYKYGKKKTNLIKVTYEGDLVVKDVNLFVNLLRRGMGKEKAYGFGMMTVIRK